MKCVLQVLLEAWCSPTERTTRNPFIYSNTRTAHYLKVRYHGERTNFGQLQPVCIFFIFVTGISVDDLPLFGSISVEKLIFIGSTS